MRLASLAVGFLAAFASPRFGILLAVFATPLLPIAGRVALEQGGLSLGEHLFAGGLLGTSLRLARAPGSFPRTAINLPLLVFVLVVLTSLARVVLQYQAAGASPWDVVVGPVQAHFSPTLGDVGSDHYLAVQQTLVVLEGAAWFVWLLQPGTGVSSRDLTNALVASAAVVCAVGVAQSIWQFAPIEYFVRTQPGLFRVSSTWHDPNTFGAYLVLILPLGLVSALSMPRWRFAASAWLGLSGYCLLTSVSRAAWVGLLASAFVAGVIVSTQPDALGSAIPAPWRRRIRMALAGTAIAAVLGVGMLTAFDAARSLVRRTASNALEMLVLSLNWRRPTEQILPGRMEHWQAALRLWRLDPLLGVGVGRYPLMKIKAPGELVDSGPGGDGKSLWVAPPGKFAGWVTAKGGANFDDVRPGDTIESSAGGWGPIPIKSRFSSTQLFLAMAPPSGERLDYAIRHVSVDPELRPHLHAPPPRLLSLTDAHNYYLKILAELGLVGLAAFVGVLGGIGRELLSCWRRSDGIRRRQVFAAGIGIVALLVKSLASDPLAVREIEYVFWSVVALAVLSAPPLPGVGPQGNGMS